MSSKEQHLLVAQVRLEGVQRRTARAAPARRASARSSVTTSCASPMGARLTKTVPSAKASRSAAATASPRRVLPTPPGPVSVTSRTSARRSRATSAATSRSRPSNGVGASGSARTVPRGGGAAASGASGPTCVGAGSRSTPRPPRATSRKVARTSGASCNWSARRAAICLEGRRSSVSSLRSVPSAQPTRSASSACVRSSALRRRPIHAPNEAGSSMAASCRHGRSLRRAGRRGVQLAAAWGVRAG